MCARVSVSPLLCAGGIDREAGVNTYFSLKRKGAAYACCDCDASSFLAL